MPRALVPMPLSHLVKKHQQPQLGFATSDFGELFESSDGGYPYGFFAGKPNDTRHLEITGYILLDLIHEIKRGHEHLEERAHQAAAFLLKHQNSSGAFPHSILPGGQVTARSHEHHVFDAGICASALWHYSNHFNNDLAYHSGLKAALWTSNAFQESDQFPALWNEKTRQFDDTDRSGFWSSRGGAYLGKLLIPWLQYGLDQEAEIFAERILRAQLSSYFWRASATCNEIHSHGLFYLLEGLIYYAFSKNCMVAHKAVRNCLCAVEEAILADSGVNEWLYSGEPCYRADSQLQYLRLAKICGSKNESAKVLAHEKYAELIGDWGVHFSTMNRDFFPLWVMVFANSLNRCTLGSIEEII